MSSLMVRKLRKTRNKNDTFAPYNYVYVSNHDCIVDVWVVRIVLNWGNFVDKIYMVFPFYVFIHKMLYLRIYTTIYILN